MLRSRRFFVRCVPAAVSLQTVCILFSLVAVTISSLQSVTAASKFLQSKEQRGEYNSKLGNTDEAGRPFGRGGGGSAVVDFAQTKPGGTPSGGESAGKAGEAKAADAGKPAGPAGKGENAAGKPAEAPAKAEPAASSGGAAGPKATGDPGAQSQPAPKPPAGPSPSKSKDTDGAVGQSPGEPDGKADQDKGSDSTDEKKKSDDGSVHTGQASQSPLASGTDGESTPFPYNVSAAGSPGAGAQTATSTPTPSGSPRVMRAHLSATLAVALCAYGFKGF